jgi:exopolyphosphatase/guanosine-5'-triphosphate,3'-diphosphate pyrophosphatase
VPLYACIDIGSNTTRLLVAEPGDGGLREVQARRVFTQLGRGLRRDGRIGARSVEEVAEVVAAQARLARELGAQRLRTVATAAIRRAVNGPELCAAVAERSGVEVDVLDGEEEARLAFLGATRTLGRPVEGEVAVADVGGGSSEIALGTVRDGVRWSASFRVGSGLLADAYLSSDPPSAAELAAVREQAAAAFAGLEVAPPALAVAVGGSATSLRRLVGGRLERETLERGVRVLAATPVAEVARRFDLDPERVRLLPAGLLVLDAICDRLGCAMQVGCGGLREGVILELAAAGAADTMAADA